MPDSEDTRWVLRPNSMHRASRQAHLSEQPDSSLTLWTGHIVDKLPGLFTRPFGPARPARSGGASRAKGAQFSAPPLNQAKRHFRKRHQPITALGLGNPDRFANQRLAEKNQLPAPADLAVRAHSPHCLRRFILRLFQPLRIPPRARPVTAGRGLLPQRLVRPLLVVDRAKAIKAVLLRRQRPRRRRRRLRL